MPILKERLPAFTEKVVPPDKMRQLVMLIERRLDALQREIESGTGSTTTDTTIIDREMSFFLGR